MPERQKFAALVESLAPGGRLLRAWALTGGVSAQVTALEIEHAAGSAQKVVVREYGAADLASDPHVAEHEFHLLSHLHGAGLPVPQPLAFDQSGVLLPMPCLVIEFVEAQSEFAPADLDDALRQLALVLARIHQVTPRSLDFLPRRTEQVASRLREHPNQLDDSLDEGRIRAFLETVWEPPQRNLSCLLHGDYWLGNILWRDGKLAAVIDWEDAAIGDPLADLADARLELVFAFGIEAMHSFTRHYQAHAALDYTNLPYWDLWVAVQPAFKIAEWAGDPATERRWRAGHAAFVAQAFAQLQTHKPE